MGVLLVMLAWEQWARFREQKQSRGKRWLANLGILLVDTLLVRLFLPMSAVGVALVAETRNWGLLRLAEVPPAAAVVISLLLLDLAIYLQHVAFHASPWLWRLHAVHHSDEEVDVTTGVRFHPAEIVLSLAYKVAIVLALGVPPVAVLLFEIVLNATSLFNHGNVRLPARIENLVRLLVVTPDMHRVHHSVVRAECDSNYGFNLACWDRLFGTYRAEASAGQQAMRWGVEGSSGENQSLLDLLSLPLRRR